MHKKIQHIVLYLAIALPCSYIQAQGNPDMNNATFQTTTNKQQLALKAVEASLIGGIAGVQAKPTAGPLVGAGIGILAGAGELNGSQKTIGATETGLLPASAKTDPEDAIVLAAQ
ncbi:MAG: hypothetical protein EP344_00695 [Bacteroidetes bacterium]|nr:MAG: hypothetical protein EP344_00695 [Bacteroidota bacterium]